MLGNEQEEKEVRADRGRCIRELRESVIVIKRDLSLLEKRVSSFEEEIANCSKNYRKMRSEISSLSAKLERISSKV